MKSRLYGALTCVTFSITIMAYSTFFSPLESQASKSGTFDYSTSEQDRTQKATFLIVVSGPNCYWCEQLKKKTISPLVAEGYRISIIDETDWEGPEIEGLPTLFYCHGIDVLAVQKGFKTQEQVKEILTK